MPTPPSRVERSPICVRRTGGRSMRSSVGRETIPIERRTSRQDFFTLLIEPGALANVTEGKGKFRSFLMAACTHFMSNQRTYQRALKRGGRRSPISIDQFKNEDWLRLNHFTN